MAVGCLPPLPNPPAKGREPEELKKRKVWREPDVGERGGCRESVPTGDNSRIWCGGQIAGGDEETCGRGNARSGDRAQRIARLKPKQLEGPSAGSGIDMLGASFWFVHTQSRIRLDPPLTHNPRFSSCSRLAKGAECVCVVSPLPNPPRKWEGTGRNVENDKSSMSQV
jgi:hypothetical protein